MRFIAIYHQPTIHQPAKRIARKAAPAARRMMQEAIDDLRAAGVALRLATTNRIVTDTGETLYLEGA